MKLTNLMAWLAAAVVMFSGGCQSNVNGPHPHHTILDEANSDLFPREPEQGVRVITDVQAANGARFDANLYAHDFTGPELNSLGRSKVLLMMQNCESCEPAVIHLVDVGDGDLLAQRRQAVELYLKTAQGTNPSTLHPAAPTMARMMKVESGTSEGGGAPPADVGGSMMGATTK